jgi:AcrR family transcriptional regulator
MATQSGNDPKRSDYAARSLATRQELLSTAVEVLIELGYSEASTLAIQRRANMSRGRLLHQFPSRDALLVAAAQHLADARIEDSHRRTEWPVGQTERCDAAVEAMWMTYHEGYFWAATELWIAARKNRSLAKVLLPGEQAIGNAVRAAIDTMFGPDLSRRAEYESVRELLNTSMRGVALTYTFDPRDPSTESHLGLWRSHARSALGLHD